jgi:hypothetical protein
MTVKMWRALGLAALLAAVWVMAGCVPAAVDWEPDWEMRIAITSGGAGTDVRIGSWTNATDGYDEGLDAPGPTEGGILSACLYHPHWDVTPEGTRGECYRRDVRFSLPQDYDIEIEAAGPVTVRWEPAEIPESGQFWLYDEGSDTWVNMSERGDYTYEPLLNPSVIKVRATWGDTCCYPLPQR